MSSPDLLSDTLDVPLHVRLSQKNTLFIVVSTTFFCTFRCLRVMAPFPVMYVDPLAVCIGSGICSISKFSKSLISPVKCNKAPESKTQKGVIVAGLCFPL